MDTHSRIKGQTNTVDGEDPSLRLKKDSVRMSGWQTETKREQRDY